MLSQIHKIVFTIYLFYYTIYNITVLEIWIV